VLEGFVKLSVEAAGNREIVFEIAGPGTLFGEIAVLNAVPRQADAKALTPCRLMVINGGLFRRALAATPEAMFAAIRLLSERLTRGTERGIDIVSLPARLRVAKALLRLVELHSEQGGNSVQMAFKLSQAELGAMAGLIRESINKHLKPWRAAGWLPAARAAARQPAPLRRATAAAALRYGPRRRQPREPHTPAGGR
jgi:CRP-like cAMP-binding protein